MPSGLSADPFRFNKEIPWIQFFNDHIVTGLAAAEAVTILGPSEHN
jgi:hypothetical protein